MNYKKYNKILIFTSIIIVFIVSISNYIIDPYAVFNQYKFFNETKPCIDKNHRFSKIPAFKLYNKDVIAIWVGSSKTWEGTNEEYESKILGGNVKNLAISGSTFEESIIMAKNAIMLHPEIKTIYLGLDFFRFQKTINAETEKLRQIKSLTIEKEELLPLILSLNTFDDSVKTIIKNAKQFFKKQKEIQYEYGYEKRYNKRIFHKFEASINKYYKDYYRNYTLDDSKFDELQEFIKYTKARGVNVVFFTTTMHIAERILIYNTNNMPNFYKFKQKLADIQPYYDFAIINEYTTEEIKPDIQNWRDSVHPSSILRKKMTDKLFLNNSDFGIYITKNNVMQVITKDNINFENYIKINPEIIEKVREWSE